MGIDVGIGVDVGVNEDVGVGVGLQSVSYVNRFEYCFGISRPGNQDVGSNEYQQNQML